MAKNLGFKDGQEATTVRAARWVPCPAPTHGSNALINLACAGVGDRAQAAEQMERLYNLFLSVDATQVEINPFGLTPDGRGKEENPRPMRVVGGSPAADAALRPSRPTGFAGRSCSGVLRCQDQL
mgnify:CR=1 FL=1